MPLFAKNQGDRSPQSLEILFSDPDPPLEFPKGKDLEPGNYLFDPEEEIEEELLFRYPPPPE
jgi:hypothetical protein